MAPPAPRTGDSSRPPRFVSGLRHATWYHLARPQCPRVPFLSRPASRCTIHASYDRHGCRPHQAPTGEPRRFSPTAPAPLGTRQSPLGQPARLKRCGAGGRSDLTFGNVPAPWRPETQAEVSALGPMPPGDSSHTSPTSEHKRPSVIETAVKGISLEAGPVGEIRHGLGERTNFCLSPACVICVQALMHPRRFKPR